MVQPLDVAINKPFKDRMRSGRRGCWWTNTPSLQVAISTKVELPQICQWISEAWEDIPNKLIKKSFGKCCITNATDGTEDYQMWEDDNSDTFAGIDEDDVDFLYAATSRH